MMLIEVQKLRVDSVAVWAGCGTQILAFKGLQVDDSAGESDIK